MKTNRSAPPLPPAPPGFKTDESEVGPRKPRPPWPPSWTTHLPGLWELGESWGQETRAAQQRSGGICQPQLPTCYALAPTSTLVSLAYSSVWILFLKHSQGPKRFILLIRNSA
jgi:hypothetical protein